MGADKQNLPSIDFDIDWQRIRFCESEIQELLTVYIVELGTELFKEAQDEFAIFGEYPVNIELWDSLFSFWLHYNYIPESFPEPISIAQRFLNEHPERLTDYQKGFIKAAVTYPCTFYVVEEIIPERRLVLLDILLNQRVVLKERMATLGLKKGLIVFGRHVDYDGQSIQLGLSPYSLPNRCYTAVVEIRQRLEEQYGEKGITKSVIDDLDFELREVFLAILEKASQPPELVNEDKEKILLHDISYDLTCSADEAFDKLKSLCPEELLQIVQENYRQDGIFLFPWGHKQSVIADLSIDGALLRIVANSKERAVRIQNEIEQRLKVDASRKEVRIFDPAEKMRQDLIDAGDNKI